MGGYLFHKGANLKVFLSISEILREESNIKSGGKSLRACLQRSWQGWRSNFLSGSGAPGILKSIFSRNFYLRREKKVGVLIIQVHAIHILNCHTRIFKVIENSIVLYRIYILVVREGLGVLLVFARVSYGFITVNSNICHCQF